MTKDPFEVCMQHYDATLKCIREDALISRLNSVEIGILNRIAHKDYTGGRFRVSDITKLSHFGSAATIHRRLIRLRKLGVITVEVDADDTRIKYLRLTDVAHEFFTKLGQDFIKLNP